MKRIQATCISQILHFRLKEGENRRVCHKSCERRSKSGIREGLDRGHTKYKILSEEEYQMAL